jgi:hypothetical protein
LLENAKRKVREWETNVEKLQNDKTQVESLKSKKRKGGTRGMFSSSQAQNQANLESKDALAAAKDALESAEMTLQLEKDRLAQLELESTVRIIKDVIHSGTAGDSTAKTATAHKNEVADGKTSMNPSMNAGPDLNVGESMAKDNTADKESTNMNVTLTNTVTNTAQVMPATNDGTKQSLAPTKPTSTMHNGSRDDGGNVARKDGHESDGSNVHLSVVVRFCLFMVQTKT